MFGKVVGRFFLGPHCGITGDEDEDTITLSELVETFTPLAVYCFTDEGKK